jgi:hypothetical protein
MNKKWCINMNPEEKQKRLKACLQELSGLLYEEADTRELKDLGSIEKCVRQQVLEKVSPEIAFFLLSEQQKQKLEKKEL